MRARCYSGHKGLEANKTVEEEGKKQLSQLLHMMCESKCTLGIVIRSETGSLDPLNKSMDILCHSCSDGPPKPSVGSVPRNFQTDRGFFRVCINRAVLGGTFLISGRPILQHCFFLSKGHNVDKKEGKEGRQAPCMAGHSLKRGKWAGKYWLTGKRRKERGRACTQQKKQEAIETTEREAYYNKQSKPAAAIQGTQTLSCFSSGPGADVWHC